MAAATSFEEEKPKGTLNASINPMQNPQSIHTESQRNSANPMQAIHENGWH